MNKTDNVRVRFAPSPTGYLHIGGLRTALFNYLFARHNNGKFILRIEDTDQTRQIAGAVENLIATLKIMGLDYDEGPDVGGGYGPYAQSQRLDIYRKYASQLVEHDNAYYCFCTPERLEQVRKLQKSQGLQTQYDRFCRNLTDADIKEKLNGNVPHVIRLKVPLDTEIKFHDIIRGTVKFETNHVDDQVLLKSDGYPTYHLANVIDDHLMNITHIIRGEEWLTSVPKHILLYRAFGWDVPELAHVPLILNPDKTKLSKRQGDVATEDFLKKGYLPEALLNFIALLGWNPGEGENRELFSREELIKLFTLEKVNPSGAVFNIEKLNWMNREYIQKKRQDDLIELDKLIKPYYSKYNFSKNLSDGTTGVTYSVTARASNLEESARKAFIEFPKIEEISLSKGQMNIIRTEISKKILKALISKIETLDESINDKDLIDKCKKIVKDLQEEIDVRGKEFFTPIRLVLSGKEHGPDLAEYMNAWLKFYGKTKIIEFIKKYIEN